MGNTDAKIKVKGFQMDTSIIRNGENTNANAKLFRFTILQLLLNSFPL
jgi:hypothetical protein